MLVDRMPYILILVGLCILMVGIVTSMAEPGIDNTTVETPPVVVETPIEENEEPYIEEEHLASEMEIREGEIREEEALQDDDKGLLEDGIIEEPYMEDELLEDVDEEEPIIEIQENVISVIPDEDNSDDPGPQTEVKKAVSAHVKVTEKPIQVIEQPNPAAVKQEGNGEKKKVCVRGKVNRDGYVWVGTKYVYESVTVVID